MQDSTEPRAPAGGTGRRTARGLGTLAPLLVCMLLAACGGGGGGGSSTDPVAQGAAAADASAATLPTVTSTAVIRNTDNGSTRGNTGTPTSTELISVRDAVRLADQASFGPSDALQADIRAQGAAGWIATQITTAGSRYSTGGGPGVHQTTGTAYCDLPANSGPNCWRDNYATDPLLWDFYRNAVTQPDQLRQRVAYTLQQIMVVSGVEIYGTYGLRNYQNALLDNAFGNYRQVLKAVALSPVMGDYLNNVNNDKAAPNENFARELLQLFSLGPCLLNSDGSLKDGRCNATYDNPTVREYAYALTGWTYPVGGATPWGCWPAGTNCRYYNGNMAPAPSLHDTATRKLLAGVTLASGQSPDVALERVLDSLMAHPNMAPFVSKQLIQHLVSSNPSAAYVARVAAAFNSGKFASGDKAFGTGQPGSLAATVAAVLLDAEARGDVVTRSAGKLREPARLFTGVLRAMNGKTDGQALGWYWGEELRQHVFQSPTVFNFYSPDYPVAGTTLVGSTFGIHNVNTALQRLNFLVYLIDSGGSAPDSSVPNAVGTQVNLNTYTADAADAAKLVDRLSLLALGQTLPAAARTEVIKEVSWWTATIDKDTWALNRVRTAAYLVFASPNYQVQR